MLFLVVIAPLRAICHHVVGRGQIELVTCVECPNRVFIAGGQFLAVYGDIGRDVAAQILYFASNNTGGQYKIGGNGIVDGNHVGWRWRGKLSGDTCHIHAYGALYLAYGNNGHLALFFHQHLYEHLINWVCTRIGEHKLDGVFKIIGPVDAIGNVNAA